MKRIVSLEDIPHPVAVVFAIQICNQPVGSDTMNMIEQTVKDYPEWFPWETKYNRIPKEVHEAYYAEAYPRSNEPIKSGEGLMAQIRKEYNNSMEHIPVYKAKSIEELFRKMQEAEEERKVQEKIELEKTKFIWDKYYKKYNLEFRK